uniref:CCR4-NOT transcription complex subunit 4 n=1 Tax=Cacopsylla melanoneura TaxID=428564 RepID=A0A8D8R3J3_9HEMI
MSVLNQSGEEQVECPLCMEPLEVDDLNFYPCTCLYQICRFCWHRIRTDENGLCPACRKAYPEDPADFKPLSQEEVARMKAEKRAKDQQRKQKITENRKHLANVRVVQRNLVFVVGLPMRLADAEILKKHEYFGKYGKIHKVVINQSTTYAGSQGPSASAYVTYQRAEDALRAIQSINNIVVDSRVIKTSLGTTKYCSHFMKNQSCPKSDCMYLHDLGDPEASFTKEAMQQGKHQEFEKKLHEQLIKESQINNNNNHITNNNTSSNKDRKHNTPSPSPPVGTIIITPSLGNDSDSHNDLGDPGDSNSSTSKLSESSSDDTHSNNKEAWPSLSQEMLGESTGTSPTPSSVCSEPASTNEKQNSSNKHNGKLDSNRAMSSHSNSSASTSSDDINILSMTAQLLEEDDDDNETQHPLLNTAQLPLFTSSTTEQNNTSLPPSLFNNESTHLFSNGESHNMFNENRSQRTPLYETNRAPLYSESNRPPPLFTNDSQSQLPLFSSEQQSNSSSLPPSLFANENASFFSSHSMSNGVAKHPPPPTHNVDLINNSLPTEWCLNGGGGGVLPDILPPVSSTEDWEAAFGFRTNNNTNSSNTSNNRDTTNNHIGSSLHQQLQQAAAQHNAHLSQQQHLLLNHLNNTTTNPAQQQMLSHHIQQQQQHQQQQPQQHQQQQPQHHQQQQQQPQQMSTNYLSRHDDDLGFDPFHETQKALAEMIEKEEQRSRLTQYHQHQQAQNLLQQNILAAQQHRDSLLQQNQLLVAQQQREQNLLQQQAREQQLQQQQAAVREQQLREQLQQQKERERLVAAMFDPRGPPSLPTLRDLSTNSSLFHKGATSPADLYTSALSNATKLLDNFCLSSSSPSRSRYPPAPPPGFSTSNGFTPGGGGGNFSPKLLDSMADHLVSSAATGSKLLPAFVQHAGLIGNSQPQSANSSLSSNFQHSQLSQAPAPAWDWTALDPAIMSAGQHCDVFTTPPPPGFTPMRQTLDNF